MCLDQGLVAGIVDLPVQPLIVTSRPETVCDYFTGTAGQCDWSVGVSSPVLSSNSSVIYLCTGPSQVRTCSAPPLQSLSFFFFFPDIIPAHTCIIIFS